MVKVFLVIVTIADFARAALLVGVSGFIFGSGPENSHAGLIVGAGYILALFACLAAPVVGFMLNHRGKSGVGMAAAWLPVAGALAALMVPAPY